MSGLYGTTQAYQPMASTYIALAPECGDSIFGSDLIGGKKINYCDLVQWGIYDGQENDPYVLALYQSQNMGLEKSILRQDLLASQTTAPTSYSVNASSQPTSIMSLLKSLPQASTFYKMVMKSGWNKYFDRSTEHAQATLFVPTNKVLEQSIYSQIPLENWNANNLRVLAQAHTLPYAFDQTAAYQRKLKLATALPTFDLYLDGTGEVSDKLNFYVPKQDMLTLRYPTPLQRINIIHGYYSNSGNVYLIDGIFDPQVIAY